MRTSTLLSLAAGALLAPRQASSSPSPAAPLDQQYSAQDVVKQLGLEVNVEKGWYVQTFEDPDTVVQISSGGSNNNNNNRSASTQIYYLLDGAAGDSRWHRVVDAAEVWHYYAGSPLTLSLSRDDGAAPERRLLGPDVFRGQRPQVAIGKGVWQSARSHGRWTLVGALVMAPGFTAASEELPGNDWKPKGVQ